MDKPNWRAKVAIELHVAADDPQAVDDEIHAMFERGDPEDEMRATIVVSDVESTRRESS